MSTYSVWNIEGTRKSILKLHRDNAKYLPPGVQALVSREPKQKLACASVASVRGGKPSIEARPPGSWIRGGSEAQVILSQYR